MESLGAESYELNSFLPRIEAWIIKNINRPIKGFESKRNADGSYYTFAQQINATRLQVIAVAKYFLEQGKTPDEVHLVIAHFR